MKISKFRLNKRLSNLIYCWGACVVILGAGFKIADLPGANEVLLAGLAMEVFIFFLSGLEGVDEKSDEAQEVNGYDAEARISELERKLTLLNSLYDKKVIQEAHVLETTAQIKAALGEIHKNIAQK